MSKFDLTYSLSDTLKGLACMFDNAGYEASWSVDDLNGSITIEGESFAVTIVGNEIYISHDWVDEERILASFDSSYNAKRLFDVIMTSKTFNEPALKIANSAASRLGLTIEIIREGGSYFRLKGIDEYSFYPTTLKQFIKVTKRDACQHKPTAQTETLIKVLQWYMKVTGCHVYSISMHGTSCTLWLGKDKLRFITNEDGKVVIKSANLNLEMIVETIDDQFIEELMNDYASKIRVKAYADALLPD